MKNSDISTKATLKSDKAVKRINQGLTINRGALDTFIDITISDANGKIEEQRTEKGHSIVANFLRALYVQMSRDVRDNIMGDIYKQDLSFVNTEIASISSGPGGVFQINFTALYPLSSGDYADGGKVALSNFGGITLEGIYDFTTVDNNSIAITGTTYSAGWTTSTGVVQLYLKRTNIGNPSENTFGNGGIIIGTGTTPVTINDFAIEKPIASGSFLGGLVYNTSTVSEDTSDATTSQITFTRTFTNSGPSTVAVNEIGLLAYASYYNYSLLMIRDVLSSAVNVAVGKTLTINYRIKTQLDTGTDAGGFITNFMRLLYRQFARTERAAIDINNISRTIADRSGTLGTIKCGGMNIEYSVESSTFETENGYKYGITIGKGITAISMSDYNLADQIHHGDSTDQMLHYGGYAQDFVIGSGYAEFSIKKAFENVSGASITIKEYGLVASGGTDSTDPAYSIYMKYLHLIARNLLTTPVVVANNEVLIINYKIRIEV